jgi:molecular chaperone GrpE
MTDTESHTTGVPETHAVPDGGEAQAPPAVEGDAPRGVAADPGGVPASSQRSTSGKGVDPGGPPASSQQSTPPKGVDPGGAIEEELDELVKTVAERDQYLALAQRTQADFENYRKRVARDAAAAQERGVVKLAKELLPALDNLDRAIGAAEDEDPLLAGVRLVRSELGAGLARLGIEAFAPLGEAFDPNLHEAVAQQPVEGAVSGAVAEVFQNGYRMGETILRPARVLVAA